jgi:CBS domain-containing protein
VSEALTVLVDKNLRCAPVVDEDKGTFVGVFDVRDMLKHAIEMYKDTHATPEETLSAFDFMAKSPIVSTQSLSYFARMKKFYHVSNTASLLDVMDKLASGAHIVGVVDENNKLVTILSQGFIYRFAYPILAKSKDVTAVTSTTTIKTLLEAGVGVTADKCVTVTEDAKAHDVFQTMADKSLSGLGIVDSGGTLIQYTSATDIKLWIKANCSLDLDIMTFLSAIRHGVTADGKTRFPISNVHLGDNLQHYMDRINATKYHRLWVTTDERKPLGVIAITDIFKIVQN